MALSRRELNELLVHGYTRIHGKSMNIPTDISNTCFSFYHLKPYFLKAGACCSINETKDIAFSLSETTRYRAQTCVCSIVMPSISEQINIEYEYKIKILKTDIGQQLCVGIMDSKHIDDYLDKDFAGSQKIINYAYNNSGSLFTTETGLGGGKCYGESFGNDTIIAMKYNPYNSTLQFIRDNKEQPMIENISKDKDLNYCLAILMGYWGDHKVQLLDVE